MFEEYEKTFGEMFPTEEYMSGNPEALIKECLDKGKKVQELYPLDYSQGICY